MIRPSSSARFLRLTTGILRPRDTGGPAMIHQLHLDAAFATVPGEARPVSRDTRPSTEADVLRSRNVLRRERR
jgi:hypothetical protein